MKRFLKTTRNLAVGLAIAGGAQGASAQFVAANNYQPQQQVASPGNSYAAQQYLAQPAYGYPRVAQAGELPTPAEPISPIAPVTPSASAITPQPLVSPPATSYTQPTSYAGAGCATGNCGTSTYAAPATTSYAAAPAMSDYMGSCGTSCGTPTYGAACSTDCYPPVSSCDLGLDTRPRRQWFAGAYYLFMNRAGDQSKSAVAYLTDTASFTGDYYPTSSDTFLNTADASFDAMHGAEIRFGSTFGYDPCSCSQPFAWEVGYWALNDDSNQATLTYPGTLSSTNSMRIYSLFNYNGLTADLDGSGTNWSERPIYTDPGDPASSDLDANDVRILGVRVRQRFQMQNLELNFWRFGTPSCVSGPAAGGIQAARATAVGLGGGCVGSCGVDCAESYACGSSGYACGSNGCAPPVVGCAPVSSPRRFFINGMLGLRYVRVDDDFGLDWQQAPVDTNPASPTYGDPPTGWPTTYTSFPTDDNSVFFSDYEADNELVGFQLGCSMNWLIGCRWNFFADTNFGIYGNNAEVYKRVYGGGAAEVYYGDGSGLAVARGSETALSTLGELRTGIGYQVSCNCRFTVAYRLIGITGVALGVEELQNTDWYSPETASHIDVNNSIVLHGLQTGIEYKY